MIFDLSKIEGLTDEQQAAITAMATESEQGLKAKNEELLGEVKGYKTKIGESESAVEEARRLASEAKEKELKLSGDMDGLKAHYEEQIATATATSNQLAQERLDALMSRDKSEVKSQIMASVNPRFKLFAETMLDNSINVSYDEKGNAKFELKLGDTVYNDAESFLSGAKENEAWQNVLSATQSSGSGAKQSGGAAVNGNSVQSRLSARLAQKGLTK